MYNCCLNLLWLLQLTEVRQRLEEVQSTASADHLAKVDLETKQHRLHGDSSRLEKRLAAVEADREALCQQLKVLLLMLTQKINGQVKEPIWRAIASLRTCLLQQGFLQCKLILCKLIPGKVLGCCRSRQRTPGTSSSRSCLILSET